MSTNMPERLPSPAGSRVFAAGVVLFLLVLVALRAPCLDAPLIDHHSFRQTQTAVTAYWFARDGITLPAYPLPVLGHPWSAPFEFPLFQMIVAGMQRVSVPPDMAARGAGLIFYLLAVVAACGLIAQLRLGRVVTWSFLTFATLAPFGIVWGRACSIEFLAVLLGLCQVSAALIVFREPHRWGMIVVALLAGAAAAAVKPTTFVVYWTPVAGLAGCVFMRMLRTRSLSLLRTAIWCVILALPLLVAFLWTSMADEVKRASPLTAFLATENLTRWNYGTLAQRLDPGAWWTIARRVVVLVFGGWFVLPALGLAALRRPWDERTVALGGLLAGSVAAVAVFFNLYLVHDYYLCALVLPLWLFAALGVGWIEERQAFRWRACLRSAIAAVLLVSSFTSFYVWSSYFPGDGAGLLPAADMIADRTRPEDELIVFGDDWNPALAYYSRRRVLMAARDNGGPDFARQLRDYARARQVRFAVAKGATDRAREVFPEARCMHGAGRYHLFQIDP